MRTLLLSFLAVLSSFTAASAQITDQVIITKTGAGLGNETSHCASLSGDGRFTIFESHSSNLVPNDVNGRSDLFLYDAQDGSIRRLSQNQAGTGQIGGENPTTCSSNISRDGSTVVYATDGAGLVDSVQTNISRLYAIDRASGSVELLTPGTLETGVFFPSVAENGNRVVFMSDDRNIHPSANGLFQAYLLERPSNTVTMLSVGENGAPGDPGSSRAEISQDGKWIVFSSRAANLKGAVLPAVTEQFQIFLLDIETGQHTLVSKNASGDPGNGFSLGVDISADGSKVVFSTESTNLIPQDAKDNGDVLLYDRNSGALELVNVSSEGKRVKGSHEIFGNVLSADGNLVMFRTFLGSFDTFRIEIYVRDRANARTYLGSFSNTCALGEAGGDSHSGSLAPDVPRLSFALGKDTRRSPLQLTLVGLDVLKNITAAPEALDLIDADVCRDSAVLAMTPFASAAAQAQGAAAPATAFAGVTYETKLRRNGSDLAQRQSKKNILALANLRPGNYSASYRVKLATPGGAVRSRFSKPTKFKIR